MKNRYIPFGYEMINGKIAVCDAEATVVKKIFNEYQHGSALSNIAKELTKDRIEIFPNASDWNKSRIKRILEDVRYAGDDTYPQIITADTLSEVQKLKDSKYNCNRCPVPSKVEHKPIYSMTYCSKCGSRINHKLDTRNKYPEAWTCQNPDCRSIIKISTDEILIKITEILNMVISHSVTLKNESTLEAISSLEIKRLENEIAHLLDSTEIENSEVKNLILQCAAKKYSCIKSARHITEKLKADFEKSGLLSSFNKELFDKTVTQIILAPNGKVSVQLKNNQIVGKE